MAVAEGAGGLYLEYPPALLARHVAHRPRLHFAWRERGEWGGGGKEAGRGRREEEGGKAGSLSHLFFLSHTLTHMNHCARRPLLEEVGRNGQVCALVHACVCTEISHRAF